MKCQLSVFASRRTAAAHFPHMHHVCIPTHQLVCFHKDELDEMPYKLYSTEHLRSFENYPTLH